MKGTNLALVSFIAVLVAQCGGSGGVSSPTGPSVEGAAAGVLPAQATSTAEEIARLTLLALQSGGTQAGIQRRPLPLSQTAAPRAASGQIYGGSVCSTSGFLDLVYIRQYTPANGEVDLSALKAVFSACTFPSGGSSLQVTGELTITGRYYGSARAPDITLSGSLAMSVNVSCPISGTVSGNGSFSGNACGTTVTTNPLPSPSPAPTAPTGTIVSLSFTDGTQDASGCLNGACGIQFASIGAQYPVTDLIGLVLRIDTATGEYVATMTATAANPFLGHVVLNVNLFNGTTGYFFTDNVNYFQLHEPLTSITLTGTDADLRAWRAGQRVAVCQGGGGSLLPGSCLGALPGAPTQFASGMYNRTGPFAVSPGAPYVTWAGDELLGPAATVTATSGPLGLERR